ncbi:butanoate--CoA ligase AAE1-like [Nicotiana tabacum]|uniref:Butanoate--CoA ligase AAE1-like n=2 Tax=Nicotiana TaxID=4085 RepID=A0AC58S408_TOBAC|nr:PREDICTED: probable acyl-activating enzyme 1, peroxisomal [Nicotiana sylvestris]
MNYFFKSSKLAQKFFNGFNRVQINTQSVRHLSQITGNIEIESRKITANYVPLTPISFLERAADVFRDRTSVVFGSSVKYTWESTHSRCLKLASALVQLGISRGNVVATLAPNVPAMQELHFAVPMAGAVICTLNTRLDSSTIADLLKHSEAKIIFVDQHLLQIAQEALSLLSKDKTMKPPILVLIPESENSSPPILETSSSTNVHEYENLLTSGSRNFTIKWPKTEFDPISINYTSGTTSQSKGVVYNHRGAYLNTISTTFLVYGMGSMPTYLWTSPMFHCNGWCMTWGMAAIGGTNVCLRHISAKNIFESISLYKVTHMGAVPTVLNMIANSIPSDRKPFPHKVEILTGGSPPPPHIFSKMEELGFGVTHGYGLTETYGVATSCLWKPEWDSLPLEELVALKARQGVRHLCIEDVEVRDRETMEKVPHDGKTIGEVMLRGNTVMSEYFKDVKATEEAFKGGWFHSGDLAVKHQDGYIEIKDRLKDIIISGGENISSFEVERVLYKHPAVVEASVVARPDDHWGQTPCAFVKLKEGFEEKITSQEIIKFCRDHLPHYMAPRTVIFEDLPKTSTGKVKKFILREKAKALGSLFYTEV